MIDLNVNVVMLVNREKIERLKELLMLPSLPQDEISAVDMELLDDLSDAERRLSISAAKLTPEGYNRSRREENPKPSTVNLEELEL